MSDPFAPIVVLGGALTALVAYNAVSPWYVGVVAALVAPFLWVVCCIIVTSPLYRTRQ